MPNGKRKTSNGDDDGGNLAGDEVRISPVKGTLRKKPCSCGGTMLVREGNSGEVREPSPEEVKIIYAEIPYAALREIEELKRENSSLRLVVHGFTNGGGGHQTHRYDGQGSLLRSRERYSTTQDPSRRRR